MTTRRVFAFWFVFGTLTMAAIQLVYALSLGGYSGLLRAGEQSELRAVIEAELPNLPLKPDSGHDGQYYFVQGIDPFGLSASDSADIPPYRFRRMGYPALASMGGVLRGEHLLAGMVVVAVVATGVASGTAAVIARDFRKSPWLALGVVLNPGVWLSGELLTADVLALALGLCAIAAHLRGKLLLAVLALAAAVLTKETAVLFTFGLAGHVWTSGRRRIAVVLTGGVLAVALTWFWRVAVVRGDPIESAGQIVLPLSGLIAASARWAYQPMQENALLATFGVFVLLAIGGLWRADGLWRWLISPWILLALTAADDVWVLGNNALRAFAPIITLTVLAFGIGRSRSRAADLFHPAVSPASP